MVNTIAARQDLLWPHTYLYFMNNSTVHVPKGYNKYVGWGCPKQIVHKLMGKMKTMKV